MPASPPRSYAPILAVVGLGTFLSALSGASVNLAMPVLGREMGISIDQSRWILQSFLLTVSALLLPMGRLGDMLGHRRLYLVGFTLFGLGSLACGLAPSFPLLVATRILQAVGGAMVMATGPALLTTNIPPAHRGKALGILSSATYSGLTLGPPIGGFIVATLGWRWIFLVNLPFAVVVLGMAHRFLPLEAARPEKVRFDWMGAATLMVALIPLMLGISYGQAWGWLSMQSAAVWGVGILGMILFLLSERRNPTPLLDLGLFRSRQFTGATLAAAANYIALFGLILLMPFFLEEGLGYSTSQAGAFLSVQPLLMALVAPFAGTLSDRLGSRGLGMAGMAVMAGGLVLASLLTPFSPTWIIVAALALIGLGTGLFVSPNSSALLGSAPRHQQGSAGSVMGEARSLGMLIGVAVGSAVFHAFGGHTGAVWTDTELHAFAMAVRITALAALAAGAFSALGGRREAPIGIPPTDPSGRRA